MSVVTVTTVLFRAPGVPEPDLVAYLTDCVRTPALVAAAGLRIGVTAWRGTDVHPQPAVTSWTDTPSEARLWGPVVLRREVHQVLAVVAHDTFLEYVTREPRP